MSDGLLVTSQPVGQLVLDVSSLGTLVLGDAVPAIFVASQPVATFMAVAGQGPSGPAGPGGELDPNFVLDGGNF